MGLSGIYIPTVNCLAGISQKQLLGTFCLIYIILSGRIIIIGIIETDIQTQGRSIIHIYIMHLFISHFAIRGFGKIA